MRGRRNARNNGKLARVGEPRGILRTRRPSHLYAANLPIELFSPAPLYVNSIHYYERRTRSERRGEKERKSGSGWVTAKKN